MNDTSLETNLGRVMKYKYEEDSLKDHNVKKYMAQKGMSKDEAEALFERQIKNCPEFVKEAARKSRRPNLAQN